jgi:branched-chain amino acid transport system ATP-binding protein
MRREEDEIAALAEEKLRFFGNRLTGYRWDQPAYSLSYANRRRLEIARATATNPRLLLLDEPAAGMNPAETHEITELIGQLRTEGGYTILVIEHDMHVPRRRDQRQGGRGLPRPQHHGAKMSLAGVGSTEPGPREGGGFATAGALLQLQAVDTYYGQIHILQGVSIRVEPGELVCLLGGNASGKSTTLKTILGIVRPRRGSVALNGEDVTRRPTSYRIAQGIAIVPENRRLFAPMTVLENLEMGAYLRGGGDREDYERVYSLFPLLYERRSQLAGTLSGGEQQMVAMGRALMSRPKLLLMDEPSMGLAPILVEKNFEIIEQVHESGVAILVVEQNANVSLSIADRGYVLSTGRLVLEGKASDLRENEELRKAYLGR